MGKNLALEQRWRDHIEESRQSGLSIKEWCIQNGFKKSAYHYWVRKFKLLEQQEAGDNTSFAEVVLLPDSINSTNEAVAVKAEFLLSFGDYSISIPNGFNPITLPEREDRKYAELIFDCLHRRRN